MHHSKGRRRNVKVGGRKDYFSAEASVTAGDRDHGNFRWREEAPESGVILSDVTSAILLLND